MERIRGVNLSGWFIPEPWVTPSLFAATGASNEVELQIALGSVAYNERMRQHYETFITEDDFRRMSAIGLNAVRLPVPWYAFCLQEMARLYPACRLHRPRLRMGEEVRHAGAARFGNGSGRPRRFE